jgi:hypothetical protein
MIQYPNSVSTEQRVRRPGRMAASTVSLIQGRVSLSPECGKGAFPDTVDVYAWLHHADRCRPRSRHGFIRPKRRRKIFQAARLPRRHYTFPTQRSGRQNSGKAA